jgi:hypothetical protein
MAFSHIFLDELTPYPADITAVPRTNVIESEYIKMITAAISVLKTRNDNRQHHTNKQADTETNHAHSDCDELQENTMTLVLCIEVLPNNVLRQTARIAIEIIDRIIEKTMPALGSWAGVSTLRDHVFAMMFSS